MTFHYRATAFVDPTKAQRLREAAEEFARSRDWWSEPLFFFEIDEDQKSDYIAQGLIDEKSGVGKSGELLDGSSKFKLFMYTSGANEYVQVESAEDDLMGYLDCTAIVQFLSDWSPYLNCGWQFECIGEPCGRMNEQGLPDEELIEFLSSQLRDTNYKQDDPELPETARNISLKYASRNE